jgi:predicted PurR-regulated permease PerM
MTPATGRTLFLVAVGILVVWLAYLARAVVTPLLVALVLAYILDPVVRLLQRGGLSRAVASGLVVVVALATIVTAGAYAATQLAHEAAGFYGDVVGEPWAKAQDKDALVSEQIAEIPASPERDAAVAALKARVKPATWDGVDGVFVDLDGDGKYQPGYAAQAATKVRTWASGSPFAKSLENALRSASDLGPKIAAAANSVLSLVVSGVSDALSGVFGLLTLSVLFPIYLYYSLVNLSGFYDVMVRHLPQGQRGLILDILQKIHVTLSAFFRGRLITMLAKGVMLFVLYAAFGVPFSLVLAAFAAVASLVPVVGGLAAAVPPLLLALPSSTGGELAALFGGMIVVEIIEGYVLTPLLIGGSVGLHPLTVLVCTMVAGELLGFFGMIVAIPLTAVVKILATELVLPEVRRRAGLPPREGGSGPPS